MTKSRKATKSVEQSNRFFGGFFPSLVKQKRDLIFQQKFYFQQNVICMEFVEEFVEIIKLAVILIKYKSVIRSDIRR